MPILNAIASLAVKDLEKSVDWYSKVLGKSPTKPMPSVAEFQFERGGWLQIYALPERAGHGSCTLSVTDIEETVEALNKLGVDTAERPESTLVKTVMITDPDGNHIAFAQPLDSTLAQ